MSFFNDLSPVGKILCGAALVVAAPVAAAAAIPVCAAIGTVGIGLGASSSAVVSAGITAVGAVENRYHHHRHHLGRCRLSRGREGRPPMTPAGLAFLTRGRLFFIYQQNKKERTKNTPFGPMRTTE